MKYGQKEERRYSYAEAIAAALIEFGNYIDKYQTLRHKTNWYFDSCWRD
jgi:hypothetical protein